MKQSIPFAANRIRRNVVAAVVLGTAISAMGSSAQAAQPDHTLQTVSDISRYCTACWRNARLHPDCWTDCTQDVFSRLMERVRPDAWTRVLSAEGEERREFLRAIDAVKKRSQRSRKYAPVAEDVADNRARPNEQRADERQAVHQAARELLTSRQQRILQMSFEGWSVQEIADELQVGAERVSDEKYKAIRKLRQHLCTEEQG